MAELKIFVDVTDVPEREELVAEAFVNNLQWCELSQESGKLEITFLNTNKFTIDFDIAIQLLNHMKDYLFDGNTSKERAEWHEF